MTATNSTAISNLLEADDLLSQTETIVSFIQSITLIDERPDAELSLGPTQVAGLYHVLNTVRDNLKKGIEKIHTAKEELKLHS